MPNIFRYLAFLVLAFLSQAASAQTANVFIEELPGSIRMEQYTGGGSMVFWRLPTPGATLFPGTNCLNVTIPTTNPAHTSRFMALYLSAGINGKKIFYVIDPSCVVVSFGMNG